MKTPNKYLCFSTKFLKYLGFPLGLTIGILISEPLTDKMRTRQSPLMVNVFEATPSQPHAALQNRSQSDVSMQTDLPILESGILGDIIVDGQKFNPVISVISRFNNTLIDPATFGLVDGFGKNLGLSAEQESFVNKEFKNALDNLIKVEKQNVRVTADQTGAQSFQIKPYDALSLKEELRINLKQKLQPVQADLLTALVTEDVIFGFSGRTEMNITADHVEGGMPEGSELEPVFVRYQYLNSEKMADSVSRVMSRKAYFERYGPLASGP